MANTPPDESDGGGSPRPPAEVANLFRREPLGWTLAYEGRSTQLKHRKGLSYIATLLREPQRKVHVCDLACASAARPTAAGRDAERTRKSVRNAIRNAATSIARAHPELGRHLHNCVVTGCFCFYRPERDTAWRIET